MRELMPNHENMPIKMPLRNGLQAKRETVGTEQSLSPCQHGGELVPNWGQFLTTQGYLAMYGDTADWYDRIDISMGRGWDCCLVSCYVQSIPSQQE